MDKRNILIKGGSSGIGFELVKLLNDDHHEVYVASRTNERLAKIPDINHLTVDATAESLNLDALQEILHGLVYCPGTIL